MEFSHFARLWSPIGRWVRSPYYILWSLQAFLLFSRRIPRWEAGLSSSHSLVFFFFILIHFYFGILWLPPALNLLSCDPLYGMGAETQVTCGSHVLF